MDSRPKPPDHLRDETKEWWQIVCGNYELEDHHLRLLQLAAEAWDRCQQAREALAKHGSVTYVDRFGAPRIRPEVKVEVDSRTGFARLVRELGLDLAEPDEPRRPSVESRPRR